MISTLTGNSVPQLGTEGDSCADKDAYCKGKWYFQKCALQMCLRSVQGCGEVFCDALLEWIKSSQFTDIVLLTSSHAHERRDSQIEG